MTELLLKTELTVNAIVANVIIVIKKSATVGVLLIVVNALIGFTIPINAKRNTKIPTVIVTRATS